MRPGACRYIRPTGTVFAVFCGAALLADISPAQAQALVHFAPSPTPPPPAAQLEGEPDVSPLLDPLYDRYLGWKEQLQQQYHIEYSVELSLLPQWASPRGGFGGLDFIWSPGLSWQPFADSGIGSGKVTFWAQQNQFWAGPNTTVFQERAGLLTPPSDWGPNATDYAVLTYTHTLPDDWRWLSATFGQYSFSAYDGNEYAGNFINYALAQNATSTYVSGDLGRLSPSRSTGAGRGLVLAGGFQGAANFSGSSFMTRGLASGKEAYFGAARWSPNVLAGGVYGLLWYSQPALPSLETTASRGLSFSAVQNVDHDWGLFLRANTVSGRSSVIAGSVAWGVVRNDPFRRDPLDRVGFGLVWDKTNLAAVAAPARPAEWISEICYDYTIFKGLRVTPDIQYYFDPALTPHSGPIAVFTLRTTLVF
ncbi:MAG TPA: carbohydrate porin [Stellaceae bacterium]